jgi:hypothetical protein
LGAVWGLAELEPLLRELTQRIAQREPVTEMQALQLASAVLGLAPVRLASAVLSAAAEHRAARALDLIEALAPRITRAGDDNAESKDQ